MVRSVEVQYKNISSDKDITNMSLMSVERPVQKLVVLVPADEEILESSCDD